jgi:hypothetical protein
MVGGINMGKAVWDSLLENEDKEFKAELEQEEGN